MVGLTLEAFSDVPRGFWSSISDRAMNGIMDCNGRLTLPEREHVWKLLGNLDEPPRLISIRFDAERLLAATGGLAADDAERAPRLLAALQGPRDARA